MKATVALRSAGLTSAVEEWPELRQEILNDLGFGLERKRTRMKDKELSSVFLRVKGHESLRAGTLLGFFPGLYRAAFRAELYLSSKCLLRPNSFRFLVNERLPHPNDGWTSVREFRRKCKSGELI